MIATASLRHSAGRAAPRGRAALVTGSTGGIGFGIARACAAAGYDVLLHGLEAPAEVEAIRRELAGEHEVEIAYMRADLARASEIDALVAAAEASFGSLQLLVNNAGIFSVEPAETTSASQWDTTQAINLTAAFLATKAALPGMKARGFGRIVNVASALGLVGQVACAAYAASKHGLVGLTRCVALETAEHGVTVNAICPGYVRTALVEREIRAMAASRGIAEIAAAAEIVSGAHPTRRFVTPAEIGALVVYLASEAAASITGAALAIDGGWTAR